MFCKRNTFNYCTQDVTTHYASLNYILPSFNFKNINSHKLVMKWDFLDVGSLLFLGYVDVMKCQNLHQFVWMKIFWLWNKYFSNQTFFLKSYPMETRDDETKLHVILIIHMLWFCFWFNKNIYGFLGGYDTYYKFYPFYKSIWMFKNIMHFGVLANQENSI
jgi:hypothetical protein